MDINTRIRQLIDNLHYTNTDFAKKIGTNQGSLGNILRPNNPSKPGFAFIASVIKTFPNLNERWLLLGEGEMWKNGIIRVHELQLVEDELTPVFVKEIKSSEVKGEYIAIELQLKPKVVTGMMLK